jgi:hypothetical protein
MHLVQRPLVNGLEATIPAESTDSGALSALQRIQGHRTGCTDRLSSNEFHAWNSFPVSGDYPTQLQGCFPLSRRDAVAHPGTRKSRSPRHDDERVSLHGPAYEDVVRGLLAVKPEDLSESEPEKGGDHAEG